MWPLLVRTLFLLILLVLPSLRAEAHRARVRTWLGAKGGLMGTVLDADHMGYSPGLGGTLGMYVPRKLDSWLEIQPELLLTTHGFRSEPPEAEAFGQRTYYVQVPLMVKMYTGKYFNFQFGGVGSMRLLATSYGPEGSVNSTEAFNTIDFGLLGGMGLDLRRGTDIALRFHYGITPVLADDQEYFPRYRAIQVTVGKRFKRFRPTPRRRR